MTDNNDTIFGFPVATVSFVEQDLRAKLAAMTERRDALLRIVRYIRNQRNEYVKDSYQTSRIARPDVRAARDDSKMRRSCRRLEADNG